MKMDSLIYFFFFLALTLQVNVYAQTADDCDDECVEDSLRVLERRFDDSVYIAQVENIKGELPKVLHAEPLYIDLIRDLGARKGEAEVNVGLGMTDVSSFTRYDALVEFEFAPINRLGVEIELPVSFYQNNPTNNVYEVPSDRINGLKLASQYTFLVSEKNKLSSAIGYIHEFVMQDFNQNSKGQFYNGNIANPFFVVAKRFYSNYHLLLYTGPKFINEFDPEHKTLEYAINTNFHYMITGTRNFIGLEVNSVLHNDEMYTTLRPQMRVEITHQFMVGVVAGIPINYGQERLSTFLRLIYEPHFKHKH
jgi:hypothetical protein